MKTRYRTNQRVLSRLPFYCAIVFMLCSSTTAQQLTPNPNPLGETISIDAVDSYWNSGDYFNNGTIDNSGAIDNYLDATIFNSVSGIIYNRDSGTIENDGTIDNEFTFLNYGAIDNTGTGTIDNWYSIGNIGSGTIQNDGTFNNYYDFENQGTLQNSGKIDNPIPGLSVFTNSGIISNKDIGTIDNSNTINNLRYIGNYGTIDNDGTIDNLDYIGNHGTIDNDGAINNSSSIDNLGTINNSDFGTIDNSETGYISNVGTIDNSGAINNSGIIVNRSSFYNYDKIDNMFNGTIENRGTFNNYHELQNNYILRNDWWDTLNNELSGIINNFGNISNRGTFNNLGTINNSDFGSINIRETFNNYSTIDNVGTIYNWGATVNNQVGATLTNNGILNNWTQDPDDAYHEGTIDNWGTINNSGTIDGTLGTFNNHGILNGTGTFVGTLDTGDGTVAPGSSAGTMFVDGDFILGGTGKLDIEIGGFDVGESDFLDITGTAFLTGGTINFSFIDGYDIITDIPGYGDSLSWLFLEADLGIDSFVSAITYDFLGTPSGFLYDVYQQGNGLYFEATNVVPAPGAVVLGLFGLGSSSWLIRRKKQLKGKIDPSQG